MNMQNDEFFWVIFDTCTRQKYYQDVHNILALPEDSMVRYDYRESQLSPSAVEAAVTARPGRALLVYAQTEGFHKGDADPAKDTSADHILWVPTRLAEVTLIPPKEGQTFYFDLRLTKYPRVDPEILSAILRPLIDSQEVPFRKWVTTSGNFPALTALGSGKDDDNWESIVNSLGQAPFQFQNDYFWRLRAPIKVDSGEKLEVQYQRIPLRETKEIRKIDGYYDIEEGLTGAFELVSYTPQAGGLKSPAAVHIQAMQQGSVYVLGQNALELRPHSADFVRFGAKRSEPLAASNGTMSIESEIDGEGWPLGAKVSIAFRVRKPAWKIVVACLLIGLSMYLGILAAVWKDANISVTIVLSFITLVLLGIAYFLLFGRIKMVEV